MQLIVVVSMIDACMHAYMLSLAFILYNLMFSISSLSVYSPPLCCVCYLSFTFTTVSNVIQLSEKARRGARYIH